MKFELKKTWHLLSCLVGGFIIISVLAFLFIALMYRLNEIPLLNLIIPNGAEGEIPTATPTNSAETLRNFAWLFWMFLSLSGAGLGLWLAWRGRQIQQESHLQERYEKAADMLSSELRATRVAACRSLMNLGKSDESMKSQCVRLLFTFINNPYLEADDKGISLDELFPANKPLRSDIRSAADSFSAIYEYYGENGVDSEEIWLQRYFWKNTFKNYLCLTETNFREAILSGANLCWARLQGANLQEALMESAVLKFTNLQSANLKQAHLNSADLQCANLKKASLWMTNFHKANLREANLTEANLQEAYLREANLQKANLRGANLAEVNFLEADISGADMREAKNLTEDQIDSARWGYDRDGEGGPPRLPKNLERNKKFKEAVEAYYCYDERKRPKNS